MEQGGKSAGKYRPSQRSTERSNPEIPHHDTRKELAELAHVPEFGTH
jgi:hypothetical protein